MNCPDPLYTPPKPYYTADFNNYLMLHHTVLSSTQDYHLELEAILVYVESGHGAGNHQRSGLSSGTWVRVYAPDLSHLSVFIGKR